MPATFRPGFLRALILSVVAHTLILAGIVSVYPVRLASPPMALKAVLTSPANPPSAPPQDAPVTRAASATAMPRSLFLPKPVVRSSVDGTLHQSELVVPHSSLVPAPAQAATSVSSPAGRRSKAGRVQESVLAGALAASNDVVDADDLRQYRIALAIAARRFKHYPALAKAQGWAGVAEVELHFYAHLPAVQVVLVRSSGHSVLDQQAQEMMADAARATLLPERLKGHDLKILLPVSFGLDDAQ